MDKYINLNSEDRWVDAEILRNAYLSYEDSQNPKAPRFISFPKDDFELGIVSSQVPEIARAVSSILTRSLEDGKNTKGGYLPNQAVERVQHEIISPYGVANLWGTTGHRFVLSRSADGGKREIIASVLVGRSKDTLFFFTGRYNNLKHSTLQQDVDLKQSADQNPNHKWFDKFAFAPLALFKPIAFHQIANFVVNKEQRGKGFARFFLDSIVKNYSRAHLSTYQGKIQHSQYLLCGCGFWQIGDPPWLPKMQSLGFYLRAGAESFFIEHDWAPLSPIYDAAGRQVTNIEYNASFGLPQMYDTLEPSIQTDQHLFDRVSEVKKLAVNPKAKLQYFQVMFNFV